MTVLTLITSHGQRRRCDAACHTAKHSRCHCVCGGKNHGCGHDQAILNTRDQLSNYLSLSGRLSVHSTVIQPQLPL